MRHYEITMRAIVWDRRRHSRGWVEALMDHVHANREHTAFAKTDLFEQARREISGRIDLARTDRIQHELTITDKCAVRRNGTCPRCRELGVTAKNGGKPEGKPS